ncbi:MAG: cobyrinate a,c-diamide synthase [Ahrensia sp.]|nr:cobyrinate a,c-diamide synthase [Ahrensia sp.]
MPFNGFLIAAPQSGNGKTIVTFGLLRALKRRGVAVMSAKSGPDYIDPTFHSLASGQNCTSLDAWAMRPALIGHLVKDARDGLLIVEGAMGLFDAAADGTGSSADLASMLGLPVVLVVDCGGQSHSIAAVVAGFRDFRPDVSVTGVILNRVGSERHEAMLREALAKIGMPVHGALRRSETMALPSRHLGLVQAQEQADLDALMDRLADEMEASLDIDGLLELPNRQNPANSSAGARSLAPPTPPLGQRIAVALDVAFGFFYSHIAKGWREAGAEISFFSPLADEAPPGHCDAVFLPGGYPELHAAQISSNRNFLNALRKAADASIPIYGECGGYMVLGKTLTDAEGVGHDMAGLLELETSFAKRRLHLGYRNVSLRDDGPLGEQNQDFAAHEFHYSTAIREEGAPLLTARDALGEELGPKGLRAGSVFGSYMHLIDRRP